MTRREVAPIRARANRACTNPRPNLPPSRPRFGETWPLSTGPAFEAALMTRVMKRGDTDLVLLGGAGFGRNESSSRFAMIALR